jgi:F-type H+-transporting ATPase subunit gamma
MPNLKDIRRRIKSVQSTKKITQAMKMVAAAKVKRAENRVKANRPYANELGVIFREVYEAMKNQAGVLAETRYGELLRERPVKNVGVVVLTSDRGLCGSYNSAVIKQALQLDKRYKEEGLNPKFYLVGNKIIRSFSRYSDSEVIGSMGNITAMPSHHDANDIAKTLTEAFKSGEIDAIQILYTRFVSMISYKVTLKPIFPLKGLIEEIEHLIVPEAAEVREIEHHKLPTRAETLLEPDPVQVLDTLIPLYLSNQFYASLLEGSASELAARMTAMSNASNNAAEMIGKLTIIYNKARQASITQEILEIVGGAEALS